MIVAEEFIASHLTRKEVDATLTSALIPYVSLSHSKRIATLRGFTGNIEEDAMAKKDRLLIMSMLKSIKCTL